MSGNAVVMSSLLLVGVRRLQGPIRLRLNTYAGGSSGVNVRELLGRPVGQVLVATIGTILAGLHRFYLPDWDVDPSWQVAMSMAQDSNLRFGPDLAFTYGPLAWLDTGAITTQSLAQGRLVFGIAATFFALLVTLRLVNRRLNPVASAALVLAGIAPMMAVTAPNEELVAGLLALCLLMVVRQGENCAWPAVVWLPVAVGVGAIAALLLLTKLSAGLLAVAIMGLMSLAILRRWPFILALWTSFVASVLLLWLLTQGNLTYFGLWGQRNSLLANSYSGAMSSYDVTALLGLGFAGMGVLVAGFAFHQARTLGFTWWCSLLVLLTEALGFYIGWKLAFVRIEPLRLSAALIMLAPLVVWAIPRTWPPHPTTLAVVAMPLASLGFAASVTLVFGKPWPLTSIMDWPSAVIWSRSASALDADLAERRAELAQRYQLSPSTLALLNDKEVHVDPGEVSTVWAYDLDWRPMPIFQNYAAFDNALDQVNLETLLASASDQLILQDTEADAIDDRNILWDPPRYQLALLCEFERIGGDERWSVLQHGQNRCSEPAPLKAQQVQSGVPVQVPVAPEGSVILARFTPDVGLLDSLVSLFLKPPTPLTATLDERTYRVPWGFDGAPLLVSCPMGATTPNGLDRVCPSPQTVTFNQPGRVEFETVEYQSG